jgi:hypothetical protein
MIHLLIFPQTVLRFPLHLLSFYGIMKRRETSRIERCEKLPNVILPLDICQENIWWQGLAIQRC